METITKKQSAKSAKTNENAQQKPKSKMVLFREKYPNGYMGGCEIRNMRAVLR